jgi:phage gp45-like
MIHEIRKMLEPIERRIRLFLGRATIGLMDDSAGVQRVQMTVFEGEVIDQVERVGEYGLSSNPLPGASAVVLFWGGNRGHGVVVATDDGRYRVHNLAPGEVAIYNVTENNTQSTIILKANGDIDITPASGNINITGTVNVTGDVLVSGEVQAGNPSIALTDHIHIGVQSGTDKSGVPQHVGPGIA